MSNRYEYENLLRAPVEYRSGVIYLIMAFILLFIPNMFLMPKSVCFIGAFFLFFRGFIRFYQGYRLKEYQFFLLHLGSFQIAVKPLLKAKNAQWIGLGFLWDGRHTQRLFDLGKPENRHLISERSILSKPKNQKNIKSKLKALIKRLLPKLYQQNKEISLPEGGGKAEIHAVGLWEGERDIGIYFSDQMGHSLVLGQAKAGKTSLLEIDLIQAIARKNHILILDAKGSPNILQRIYEQTYIPQSSISIVSHYDHALCSQISWDYGLLSFPKGKTKLTQEHKYIWRYLFFLAEIVQSTGQGVNILKNIHLSPQTLLFQVLEDYLVQFADKKIFTSHKNLLVFYYKHNNLHTEYYSAIYEILMLPVEDLESLLLSHADVVRRILDSILLERFFINQQKKKFKQLVKTEGSIVYFNFQNVHDKNLLSIYISVIQEELINISRTQRQFQPFIIADEMAQKLDDKITSLVETADQIKARLSMYEQDIPNISKSISDKYAATNFFLSLFNQLIVLRSTNQYICDYFMQRQKDVYVTTTDLISGAADNSNIQSDIKFSSSTTLRQTKQKTQLLSLHDFASLPIGQAFCLLEGNQLYKIRSPLVEYDESLLTKDIKDLILLFSRDYYSVKQISKTNFTDSYKKNNYDMELDIGSSGIVSSLSSPDNFVD